MPKYKDSPEVRAAKQERKDKLREFLSLLEVDDMHDLRSLFKRMVGEVLENGLEAELDGELGYGRQKDVLGMYVGENESAKYWLQILNGLKNRGVEDILITCINGLTGFPEAISRISQNGNTAVRDSSDT